MEFRVQAVKAAHRRQKAATALALVWVALGAERGVSAAPLPPCALDHHLALTDKPALVLGFRV